ncbi:hypothetical protein [Bradyrhizobium sp. SZCCHNR1015]|uniref:hypothetical protein n=1 Tax=Bradyrhizobium sp. SZCCHNR1015 TaxID=3057338 RepID=UPI002916E280|nr:hypothetical protein [Bradyrhizobium sp. SZCCHNR1015]
MTLNTLDPLAMNSTKQFSKERAKPGLQKIANKFRFLWNQSGRGPQPSSSPFLPGRQDLPPPSATGAIASQEVRLY